MILVWEWSERGLVEVEVPAGAAGPEPAGTAAASEGARADRHSGWDDSPRPVPGHAAPAGSAPKDRHEPAGAAPPDREGQEPGPDPSGRVGDPKVLWFDVRAPEPRDWDLMRRRRALAPFLWSRLEAGTAPYGVEAAGGTLVFQVLLPTGRPCLVMLAPGEVTTVCDAAGDEWARLRERLATGAASVPRTAPWLLYFLLEDVLHNYGDHVQRLEDRLEPVEARFLRDEPGSGPGGTVAGTGPGPRSGAEPAAAGPGVKSVAGGRSRPRFRRPRSPRPARSGAGSAREADGVALLSTLHRRAGQLHRRLNSLSEVLDRLLETSYNGQGEGLGGRQLRPYLRALRDHADRLSGRLENARELVVTLMNLRLALAAERTNRLILRLTVLSTIFLPLTFLTGIYGMNFKYMPELDLPWAYPALLAFMLVLGVGLWWFLKREYEG
ncbi:Mg2 transporter protein CorA family protein [Thermaerobacter marianensis DSM 12885]|uniref:Mg2 transporter protein CorA family protein n=1 Tax=Thermaerobacter marianensis (strain ATCC 700841 / DSM 12885 / JCM 10246 / 7p75a) TaxID=644966 RepID=E6SJZ9_THEM7|nr:CorA family divalent cation transporter [Thermaerobacter marianensis]ADU52232.1 Mg2 transporter protein CorA family protein [Thermaerobacter marianensis DSM 12885]